MAVRTTRRDPQDTDAARRGNTALRRTYIIIFTCFDIIYCIIKVHYEADNA